MGVLSLAVLGLTLQPAAPSDATGVRAEPVAVEPDLDAERLLAADQAAGRGLDWLAGMQRPDGYWSADVGHKQGDDYLVLRSGRSNDLLGQGHVGVSALAGMAFLAGGHLPDRGPHGATVRRCVDYMLSAVSDSGVITDGGTRMYSHAFATLFLAEVHGMAGGPEVRSALERAVHLIVDCQNAQGGWRYNPFTTEADMSVTVCQLQALRAARNIGIRVPKRTIDDAVAYVLRARTPQGLYYYRTAGIRSRTKDREFAINAAALTALTSAGVHAPAFHEATLDWLMEEYARVRRFDHEHFYYWYGNYYACQAFFQSGGDRFRSYQRRLVDDLLASQAADGRWRNSTGPGDVFSTAVATLLLQLPKQYLPIFQR